MQMTLQFRYHNIIPIIKLSSGILGLILQFQGNMRIRSCKTVSDLIVMSFVFIFAASLLSVVDQSPIMISYRKRTVNSIQQDDVNVVVVLSPRVQTCSLYFIIVYFCTTLLSSYYLVPRVQRTRWQLVDAILLNVGGTIAIT